MERDSLRELLYSLARFGLFWLINIFGVIMGYVLVRNVIGTFFPRLQLYSNPVLTSL